MSLAAPDLAGLERRRSLSLRAAGIALAMAVVGWPLGISIGGTENRDTIGGALLTAAIIGLIATPWIVRAWTSHMRRRMLTAAVADRPDIRHIDAENDLGAARQALASDSFSLGAFQASGLVTAFEAASVNHVLTGQAGGVPFALAEVSLFDGKEYRMFGGVLASFRLARSRPGLTIVARDQGALGNLIARAGSAIERLPLEDPEFEGIFEVYGDDQVMGRVILTTTMLERLKALDELGHARGFACAFLGDRLLVAFPGMHWRCAPWRILRPLAGWLGSYGTWLKGLIELPVGIVQTLNLSPAADAVPPPLSSYGSVPITAGGAHPFSAAWARLVGEGGMALAYVASGSLFGGLALFFARYGLSEGFGSQLFWYAWGMVAAGIAYGAGAVAFGLRDLGRLAWGWNAPLRGLRAREPQN